MEINSGHMKKLDEREDGVQKKIIIQMSPRHTMDTLFIHADETSTTVGCPRDEKLGVASRLVL